MPDNLQDLQNRANKLKESQQQRDAMYKELEQMYLITDADLPSETHIKKTYSPDPRNAIQGAVRMLSGAYPKYSIPRETNDPQIQRLASMYERLAAATWVGSCRVQRKLVHKEACLSALLYSEIHCAIKSAKSIAAASGMHKKRADAALQRTPVLFEILPPRACYAEYDGLGLAGHYQYKKAYVGAVIAAYGKPAEAALEDKQRSELIDLSEWWDENNHAVWIGQSGAQIVLEDNPYEYIPIAAAMCEGSELFQENDQQSRQPMLYTSWKSQSWKRKNLGLTAMATTVFNVLANPQLVYKGVGEPPQPDYSVPGGIWGLGQGESLEVLGVGINAALVEMIGQLGNIEEESTMYKQALGQPLGGGNAPYSAVSLLAQAGRLPLVIYQRVLSFVLGDAMQIGFKIIKEDGLPKQMTDAKGKLELKASEIPDNLEIECNLELDEATDERQNAMIAMQLAGGQDPLVSKETAASRWLNIEQYDDERRRIWQEQFEGLQAQAQLQRTMMQIQQQMAMQQQQQMGGPGVPPQGMPPQGLPPEMVQGPPPDMFGDVTAQMQGAPGAGMPALPMTSPMDQGMEQGLPGNPMEQMQGGY